MELFYLLPAAASGFAGALAQKNRERFVNRINGLWGSAVH